MEMYAAVLHGHEYENQIHMHIQVPHLARGNKGDIRIYKKYIS